MFLANFIVQILSLSSFYLQGNTNSPGGIHLLENHEALPNFIDNLTSWTIPSSEFFSFVEEVKQNINLLLERFESLSDLNREFLLCSSVLYQIFFPKGNYPKFIMEEVKFDCITKAFLFLRSRQFEGLTKDWCMSFIKEVYLKGNDPMIRSLDFQAFIGHLIKMDEFAEADYTQLTQVDPISMPTFLVGWTGKHRFLRYLDLDCTEPKVSTALKLRGRNALVLKLSRRSNFPHYEFFMDSIRSDPQDLTLQMYALLWNHDIFWETDLPLFHYMVCVNKFWSIFQVSPIASPELKQFTSRSYSQELIRHCMMTNEFPELRFHCAILAGGPIPDLDAIMVFFNRSVEARNIGEARAIAHFVFCIECSPVVVLQKRKAILKAFWDAKCYFAVDELIHVYGLAQGDTMRLLEAYNYQSIGIFDGIYGPAEGFEQWQSGSGLLIIKLAEIFRYAYQYDQLAATIRMHFSFFGTWSTVHVQESILYLHGQVLKNI